MAFNYARPGQVSFGASVQQTIGSESQPQAHVGPDLQEIQTESLGFLSIAGDSQIRLLPSAWPLDNLPPPTSSLLSVASRNGLLAAAGPDSVVIASTDAVRSAFETPVNAGTRVKPFQPQMTLQLNIRISQVVFTADERYLILSAESGGGLAIYDVQSMLSGSSKTAFEMSTNGHAVRALVTNPTQEKGELVAIITADGKLMMADLNERKFVGGSGGQILKDHVSCAAWSTRGKQLMAGLADGAAFQMTPLGEKKADIPRPPGLDAEYHVSSLSWLENNVFLMAYTPTSFGSSAAPGSVFFVVSRQPPNNFQFQKITDPTTPFGLNRSPPHHFVLRLKDFPPNLQDLLIVASTASTDIGLLSRSKTPLDPDKAAETITDVFTMTELADDSRRAALPVAENADDTSPIGLALDLSSRQNVVKPIPSDEMGESKTPVPNLMVLNNDGMLSSWWIIYSDSIRQGMIYPALVAAIGIDRSASTAMSSDATMQRPASAQISVAERFSPSFEATAKSFSTFGSRPGLGNTSAAAFGAPSILSKAPSLWGSPTNQQSSSGISANQSASGMLDKPAATSVAFGSSAFPGNRVSPWATAPSKAVASTTSGGSADNGNGTKSVFGSASNGNSFGSGNSGSGGGFAAFASKSSGFSTTPAITGTGHSPFGSTIASKSFAAPVSDVNLDTKSNFGTLGTLTKTQPDQTTFDTQTFKLGTTFTAERQAEADEAKPTKNTGVSMFGSDFGTVLGTQVTTDSPETNMDEDEPEGAVHTMTQASNAPAVTRTLIDSPQSSSVSISTPAPIAAPDKSGSQSFTHSLRTSHAEKPDTTNLPHALTEPGVFAFGKQVMNDDQQADNIPSATAPSQSKISHGHFSVTQHKPTVKEETPIDSSSADALRQIPEAPLPPDTTTETNFEVTESSHSPTTTDAPLPPDFFSSQSIVKKTEINNQPSDNKGSDVQVKEIENVASLPTQDHIERPLSADLHASNEQLPADDGSAAPKDAQLESQGIGEEEHESDFETEDDDDADADGDYSQSDRADDTTADLSRPPSRNERATNTAFPKSTDSIGTSKELVPTNAIPASKNTAHVRSLFGEISDETRPKLPPPKGFPVSPRSPSPVRPLASTRMANSDKPRTMGAFSQASQILKFNMPPSESPYSIASQLKISQQHLHDSRADEKAKAAQAFVDEDDESTQRYLAQPLQGTTRLDEFVAHQDYVGESDKDSIPSQTEAVFRDINSMVDTLGINVRALQNFMKGHLENRKEPPRTKADLPDDTEWCLVEIRSLYDIVVNELSQDLQEGSVSEFSTKMDACRDAERSISKLRLRTADIKTLLAEHLDLTRLEAMDAQSLSTEQATQQHDLRQQLLHLQKLLNETEESLTLLRTRLISHQSPNRAKQSSVPTVEAVLRTISKMISMAEKRSSDVDMLESQMRHLRMSSEVSNNTDLSSSVGLDTPISYRLDHFASSGRHRAPESARGSPIPFKPSTSVSNGFNAEQSPVHKKLIGYSSKDKEHLSRRAAQQNNSKEQLKAAVRKLGPRLTTLNGASLDDEK